MKFILPSVLFILLPTKAVAGLRKDVDDGPVTHVSLAKKKHGKQHKEDRSGEPRVESFGIAGLGIQGSKVKKQIADSHLSNLLNSDFDSRIVGGSQSSPAEFPYFVDLNGCGGSLIAPNVVLSAAHCDPYGYLLGSNALVGGYERQKPTYGAVWVNIEAAEVHPQYDEYTTNNDFLLLRLSDSVDISQTPPLSVNFDSNTPEAGDDLTVLGVGTTSEGSSQANILRDVVVDAISNNACNNNYGGQITSSMFCAGYPQGGKDSCQGDSGGPIVKKVGNSHVQVGVVSWGVGCAQAQYPGVYSRVSTAESWIKQVVCSDWNADASFCGGGGGPSCSSSEIEFGFTITTDDYGDEISWKLRNSDGSTAASGGNYGNSQTDRDGRCLPNDCYTLTISDTYGDGLCCGNEGEAGYTLIIDGNTIADEGNNNFGSEEVLEFCGGGGGGGSGGGGHGKCAAGELDVAFTFTTDDYGSETSWELTGQQGKSISAGNGYDDSQMVQATGCLAAETCYTLTLFDSYGDGLICGSQAGYQLVVDGTKVAEGSNDNFGYEISWEFGNCGGGNSGENDGGGGNCAPLRLDMVTDDWGGEISMYLTDLYSQEMLWSNFDFGSNKYYIYEECMDPDGCTELEIWDSHGDGLVGDGYAKITFNDIVYFNSGNYGQALIYRFGNGCP